MVLDGVCAWSVSPSHSTHAHVFDTRVNNLVLVNPLPNSGGSCRLVVTLVSTQMSIRVTSNLETDAMYPLERLVPLLIVPFTWHVDPRAL